MATDMEQEQGKDAPISCPFCGGYLTIEDENQEQVQCPFCGRTSLLADLMGDTQAVKAERIRQQEREAELQQYAAEEREAIRDEEQVRKDIFRMVKSCVTSLLSLVITVLLVSIFLHKLTYTIWRSKGSEEKPAAQQTATTERDNSPLWEEYLAKDDISWDRIVMAAHLPKPSRLQGSYTENDEKTLHMRLDGVTASDLQAYQTQCYDMGYQRERVPFLKWAAFNEEGYRLELDQNEVIDQLVLNLTAPIPLEPLHWQENETAKLLPAPDSEIGWVEFDLGGMLQVFIGDTDKEAVDAYCTRLEEAGFQRKKESAWKGFYGDNGEGVSTVVSYYGNSIMEIHVFTKAE